LARSSAVLTSQPFVALLSQSARPARHDHAHAPAAHDGAAPGREAQAFEHTAQCSGDASDASHPFAALPSQSAYPSAHRTMVHSPERHMEVA
jgi:hypothetical protein